MATPRCGRGLVCVGSVGVTRGWFFRGVPEPHSGIPHGPGTVVRHPHAWNLERPPVFGRSLRLPLDADLGHSISEGLSAVDVESVIHPGMEGDRSEHALPTTAFGPRALPVMVNDRDSCPGDP